MIKIDLFDGSRVPLNGKSLLILPAGSSVDSVVNKEDDYDVILIVGGQDRTIDIELRQPAIIVVDGGIRTTVNVSGGMALPISKAVFIGGAGNAVNGLTNQCAGLVVAENGQSFDLSAIASLSKVVICK